jgi:hypothetical protein
MAYRALLGPQRSVRTIATILARIGGEGPLCAVTAGWQEREGEIEELEEHIAGPTTELALYRRAEAVFAADAELKEAYRERQETLLEMQKLYRRRLDHALAAVRELHEEPGRSAALDYERRSAMRALKTLDREHLRRIRLILDHFERTWTPAERPVVADHRRELAGLVAGARAVLIAGGHVEVLLNRLRLFGFAELLAERTIVAWSAGAMALCPRVVLFHDHPPQGAGNAEVSDAGLGLSPGIIALPHAANRLRLNDPRRVSLFASRFAPARGVTLDDGAWLLWRDGRLVEAEGCFRLMRRGGLRPVKPS